MESNHYYALDHIDQCTCKHIIDSNLNHSAGYDNDTVLKFSNQNILDFPSCCKICWNHITHIYCHGNSIKKLSNWPNNIQYISCSDNNIEYIENIPDSLCGLNIENNKLKNIDIANSNLKILNLSGNLLNCLYCPITLQQLGMRRCYSSSIDICGHTGNLTLINISCCDLKFMPNMTHMKNLTKLIANDNHIEKVDGLPDSIKFLNVTNNKIVDISSFPSKLQELYISSNELTKLKILSKSIKTIYCCCNKLKHIYIESTILSLILCKNNPIFTMTLYSEVAWIESERFFEGIISVTPTHILKKILDHYKNTLTKSNLDSDNKIYVYKSRYKNILWDDFYEKILSSSHNRFNAVLIDDGLIMDDEILLQYTITI
jgi:hypothetical protein